MSYSGINLLRPNSNPVIGYALGVNMNITTDQAISISGAKYVIRKVVVCNASINLTIAAGGVYTATSKGGFAVVAATQVYSALSAAARFVDLTLAAATDTRTEATLYLSLTTGQGAAATADIYIVGDVLPT